ncbi:MAG TPA: PIG-L family deacetylase [Anaerolineaceae bacterium]|nr:PIG-L family deacetylase [Anaerolineaceae bacterium]
MIFPEWEGSKKIMVILAHPDDPEFFLGGTIAEWAKQGHKVSYLLLTKGQRGVSPEYPDPALLGEVRVREQQNAAVKLGIKQIEYLDYQDGYLVPDIEARKKVTREIRRTRPDIVATFDPLFIYQRGRINHPDHRAAGQIVIDAIFPAVENPAFFPDLLDEGLLQHRIKELWLCSPVEANFELDVTGNWQSRLDALLEHVSQVGEPKEFLKQMESKRRTRFGEEMCYVESFRRLIL